MNQKEPSQKRRDKIRCSFCGRTEDVCRRLISGKTGYICDDCVRICHNFLKEEEKYRPFSQSRTLTSPPEIKRFLDEYIIGQERAKRVISVAVYNHYKRVFSPPTDVEMEKSNILLIGPTGVGKTLLAETLAKYLNVPFSISDATPLTEAGYVGEDVENILLRLIQAANFDIALAEIGIIYIDEIDKLSRKSDSPSITRDVSGEGVQQALLKILEGTIAHCPPQGGRKHPEAPFIPINTKNILFIAGGTFEGLEKIVEKRLRQTSLGFHAPETKRLTTEEILSQVEPEDLLRYGFIPEFIGRFPVIATLHPLSKEALVEILTKPRNALIKQFQRYFEMEGVKLTFTPEALTKTADLALKKGTGARALKSILENALLEIMFELPNRASEISECIITPEVITGESEPIYIEKSKRKKAE
ncbi:MAG: ATP-dependent Clp protease ATP-binding subunit ClpX [candidate division WOR-3 bacterium]